jgi:transposase-like protein
MFALMFYISGLSMTRTAKIVGVSPTSIVNWVREFELPQGHGEVVEVGINEMWHYIQKNEQTLGLENY